MLKLLDNLNLTTTHYIAAGVVALLAIFAVYYFFFRGSSAPQIEEPPVQEYFDEVGSDIEAEHYNDYDTTIPYEDYEGMPDLEPAEPQPQPQPQPNVPEAANAGTGGFQQW